MMTTPTAAPAAPATNLSAQKLAQAQSLLKPSGLDAWLILVRESSERPDPILRAFLDLDFTWNTFFLVTPTSTTALVATFDAPDLERRRLFDEILTYKEGPKAQLLDLLRQKDPKRIGINVSVDDALADGLTAGLRDYLVEAVAGTPFSERFVSAAPLVSALRGVKLAEEQARIRSAIDETEAIFDRVRARLRIGQTAREVAAEFHAEAKKAGFPPAWPVHHCPSVTVGAHAAIGHVGPGEERIEPGTIIHMDFGIVKNGFCSDLQRMWYVAAKGGDSAPAPITKAYAAIVDAIDLAAKSLVPGVQGWEIDQKARSLLVARGYPEYAHALGHHLGRAVHDGGGVLGPRWERYGREPFEPVREGNVYTLEPSIILEGHGLVALEEDVVVGPKGAEFLSRFQRELPVLRLA
ncbi:MAG: M24 family metallopeptidase [Candidatus Eiseniibacteriota bacterium]